MNLLTLKLNPPAPDQEPDPEVSVYPAVPSHSTLTMFMPYIEGPKMNLDYG